MSKGSARRSIRPASIFEKSRISSMSERSACPEVFTARI